MPMHLHMRYRITQIPYNNIVCPTHSQQHTYYPPAITYVSFMYQLAGHQSLLLRKCLCKHHHQEQNLPNGLGQSILFDQYREVKQIKSYKKCRRLRRQRADVTNSIPYFEVCMYTCQCDVNFRWEEMNSSLATIA